MGWWPTFSGTLFDRQLPDRYRVKQGRLGSEFFTKFLMPKKLCYHSERMSRLHSPIYWSFTSMLSWRKWLPMAYEKKIIRAFVDGTQVSEVLMLPAFGLTRATCKHESCMGSWKQEENSLKSSATDMLQFWLSLRQKSLFLSHYRRKW